jgi:hypothetical protein
LPGDKKEDFVKDKNLSLDAQLAAVQAHIEDLEVIHNSVSILDYMQVPRYESWN